MITIRLLNKKVVLDTGKKYYSTNNHFTNLNLNQNSNLNNNPLNKKFSFQFSFNNNIKPANNQQPINSQPQAASTTTPPSPNVDGVQPSIDNTQKPFLININDNIPKTGIDYTAQYKSPINPQTNIFQTLTTDNRGTSTIGNGVLGGGLPGNPDQWKGLNQFQNLMRPSSTLNSNNPFKSPLPNFNFVNNLNLKSNINNNNNNNNSENNNNNTDETGTTKPALSFNFNFKPKTSIPNTTTSATTIPTTATATILQEPLKFTSFKKQVDIKNEVVEESIDEAKKLKQRKQQLKKQEAKEKEVKVQEVFDKRPRILMTSTVTIETLAQSLSHPTVELAKSIIRLGIDPKSIKDIIQDEVIELLSEELNFIPLRQSFLDEGLKLLEEENEDSKDQQWTKRAPVVTIVGHIDHGKTSLLDYLRNSSVVKSEAGRITQHIGAFQVPLSNGKSITFMDTPGHAAFTTMRERGVGTTDIALLIVAADDGVQEQTIEAIRAIKKAGVQMIVAINKIDRQGVDSELVKQQLLENEVAVEGYGGSIPCVEISAKTGQGINQLEDTIQLLSEVMDLRAPLNGRATGVVIESTFKRNRGVYSTVLTKRGILKVGDWFLCGESYGKIKELRNHLSESFQQVQPGTPIEIFGFRSQFTPAPADELYTFETEKQLQDVLDSKSTRKLQEQIISQMEAANKEKELKSQQDEPTPEELEQSELKAKEDRDLEKELGSHITVKDGKKYVGFYVKGDVGGSTEALISQMRSGLPDDPEISFNIIRTAHGEVNEKDITESMFIKTPIIYFGPRLGQKVIESASNSNIPIIQGDVIYHVIDNVAKYLESQMDPVIAYDIIGTAKIQQIFQINKNTKNQANVAGCKVQEGKFKSGSELLLKRGNDIVEGQTSSIDIIKHFKEIVKEISKGQECGIQTENEMDFQVDDILLNVIKRKEGRKLGTSSKPKYYNKY